MKLKINEAKSFEFDMDTSGVSWDQLKGYFRLTLEDVEYGFPVEINEKGVKVNIPIFKDVLHESVRTSLYEHKEVTVNARLDLIANDEVYIKPWSGSVDIEIPVSVKIVEEKEVKTEPRVKVVDPDVSKYLEEEKKSQKKSKLLDALSELTVKTEKEEKKEDEEEVDEGKEEKMKDKEQRKLKKSKFSGFLD